MSGRRPFICKSLLTPGYVGKWSESYIRTADYIRLCFEILWLFSTRCDGHFHIYPSTANELDFIPDIASITF